MSLGITNRKIKDRDNKNNSILWILKNIWYKNNEDKYEPKYDFLNNVEYKKIRALIWKPENMNVIWTGSNAIIIDHPFKEDTVIKISKPWWDNLKKEIQAHYYFYTILNKLKLANLVDSRIKIPYIKIGLDENFFEMEKIKWQSVVNIYYKQKYKNKLKHYSDDVLQNISDEDFEQILINEEIRDKPRVMNYDKTKGDKMFDELYDYADRILTPLWFWTATQLLEDCWLQHRDMHPWNVMVDNEANIYIIDFWRVKIDESKINNI